MKNIEIRQASNTLEDMLFIHQLVRELATFELEPEQHTATPQNYLTDFENGWFKCLLAIDTASQTAQGLALFHTAYSSWKGRMMYLDDLIVTQQARGQGIGKLLLDAFIAQAKIENAVLAKWQVLDWNNSAIAFYQKQNAKIEHNWLNVKLPL
jgi:GNAT superfamily N-acetyltransferase